MKIRITAYLDDTCYEKLKSVSNNINIPTQSIARDMIRFVLSSRTMIAKAKIISRKKIFANVDHKLSDFLEKKEKSAG